MSYDASTRRAVVQPGLRLTLRDGTTRRRSELVDVPVLAQAGGGYLVHAPLEAGDAVMLGFTQRGFSQFKKTLKESDPDVEAVLSPAGAYVLGSFVDPNVSLAATDGLVMQKADGTVAIAIRSGSVEITAPTLLHNGVPIPSITSNSGAPTNSDGEDGNIWVQYN